jgi:hypothetical protein
MASKAAVAGIEISANHAAAVDKLKIFCEN